MNLSRLKFFALLVFTLLVAQFWSNHRCCLSQEVDQGNEPAELIPNTQPLLIPMTPPEKALDMLTLPEGFHATLFAAEPDIHQPIAATFDTKGRLWVVECYTYSDRNQNYDMSLNDRVVIFEDSDNDGKFDSRKVFWDQGKKLTGIEIGFGGVWLTSAPRLVFIPDQNGDDVPDGEPETVVDGFEDDRVRHNIVNGLRWGPDGWLYGRHGIMATSFVGRPGATESQRTPMNCAIWRIHPISKTFEVVAQGGTNPWGFDFDQHGEMFMINTVIGHLFHVVPNARYRRMYGSHFNPHTYQIIEQTADHFHWDTSNEGWTQAKKDDLSDGTDRAGGGHAHCGLMIYQGSNWPKKYQHRLYTCNFHGRRINSDWFQRESNSYVAHHGPDIIHSKDPWFRGVELLSGPNGDVFLLDWSDIGECHENDGIHRTSGRIFNIRYGDSAAQKPFDLTAMTNLELLSLQNHEDQWWVRKARRVLQERAARASERDRAKLAEQVHSSMISAKSDTELLRLIWTAYSCDVLDDDRLLRLSASKNEHIRAWCVRLFCDGQKPISDKVFARLLELAKNDSSGLVRLYLASSLPRFSDDRVFDLAEALGDHASDGNDRVQPKLVWYGVEPSIVQNIEQSIELLLNSEIGSLQKNIARRLASEYRNNPELLNRLLSRSVEHGSSDVALNILSGIAAAFEGWNRADQPVDWPTFSDLIASADNEQKDAVIASIKNLNLLFGDQVTLDDLYRNITNHKASIESRRNAIETVGKTRPDQRLFNALAPLVKRRELTKSIIRAMAEIDNKNVPKVLLGQFKSMDPVEQRLVVDVLATRQAFCQRLLSAISDGLIPKQLLTTSHARQIANFNNSELDQKLSKVWGTIRSTSADKKAKIEQLQKQLSPEKIKAANFTVGQSIFEKTCASCHVLKGKGGTIGPDLTGSDRKNLNYLLENIVDPSSSVAESYLASNVLLFDGRLLDGIVVEETENVLKLQTKEALLAIDQNDVEEILRTKNSLMPEGQLDQLTIEEIAALIKFLQQ